MTRKKPFHHRDLKRALYEAAIMLLDSGGISAVTIRAVARETGVSHAAPVNHYKDRSALLTAIACRQFEAINDNIEQRFNTPNLPAIERIDVIANVMFDYGLTYPNRYQLLWRRDLIDYIDPRILQVTDNIYDALCDEIEKAIPEANVDRHTVATALWSMIHGYIEMRRNGMFLEQSDTVSGLPRRSAMLGLFRAALGVN